MNREGTNQSGRVMTGGKAYKARFLPTPRLNAGTFDRFAVQAHPVPGLRRPAGRMPQTEDWCLGSKQRRDHNASVRGQSVNVFQSRITPSGLPKGAASAMSHV